MVPSHLYLRGVENVTGFVAVDRFTLLGDDLIRDVGQRTFPFGKRPQIFLGGGLDPPDFTLT